jgi:hypothetical protein
MKIFVATYTKRSADTKSFAALSRQEALKLCADDIRARFFSAPDIGFPVATDPEKLIDQAWHAGWVSDHSITETDLRMPIIVADVSGGVFNGVHIDADESELDLTIVMVDSDTEIGADHCIVESNSCLADNNQIYGSIFKPMRLDGLLANDIVDALRRKGDEVAAEQSMASTNTHPTA